MNRSATACICVLICLPMGHFSNDVRAAQPFEELSTKLPAEPNAIVALNVEKIFASPIGQAEGWREKYTDRFESGPLMVPPKATEYLLAAELELASMSPRWEAALFNMSTSPTTAQILEVTKGTSDRLQGLPAVSLDNQTYLLQLGAKQFGLMRPANRQQATRWAAAAQRAVPKLSPYLEKAVSYSDQGGTEIILALDLSNMLTPEVVRDRVRQSKLRERVEADEDQIVSILTGVQGITFGARAEAQLHARLKIDFAEDVAPLAPVTKPLILNLLRQAGAALPEMEQWQVDSEGKRLSLKGTLTADGLRRVLSLIHMDASLVRDQHPAEESAQQQPTDDKTPAANENAEDSSRMRSATRRYFRRLETYVRDLGHPQATDFSHVGLWMQNFARRIQDMPTRSVDLEAVALGQHVARELEQTVIDLYGISQEAATQTAAVGPAVRVRVGAVPTLNSVNFGGRLLQQYVPVASTEVDASAVAQRASIQQQANAEAVQVAQQRMANIYSGLDQMRATLNQRYGGGF